MTSQSALTYFRGAARKAVITGGDRPEILFAALQTDTSVLILTGNLYPDVRVLAKAEELEVPVLLVPYDTFTTITELASITGRINTADAKKIDLAKKMVNDHVEWKSILSKLFVE